MLVILLEKQMVLLKANQMFDLKPIDHNKVRLGIWWKRKLAKKWIQIKVQITVQKLIKDQFHDKDPILAISLILAINLEQVHLGNKMLMNLDLEVIMSSSNWSKKLSYQFPRKHPIMSQRREQLIYSLINSILKMPTNIVNERQSNRFTPILN